MSGGTAGLPRPLCDRPMHQTTVHWPCCRPSAGGASSANPSYGIGPLAPPPRAPSKTQPAHLMRSYMCTAGTDFRDLSVIRVELPAAASSEPGSGAAAPTLKVERIPITSDVPEDPATAEVRRGLRSHVVHLVPCRTASVRHCVRHCMCSTLWWRWGSPVHGLGCFVAVCNALWLTVLRMV